MIVSVWEFDLYWKYLERFFVFFVRFFEFSCFSGNIRERGVVVFVR